MKKTVSLDPGESKRVDFSFVPQVAKSYAVSADGLIGSFIAREEPGAEFIVSDLLIEPAEVYVGDTVTISVTVTNVGDVAGSYEVNCEVI